MYRVIRVAASQTGLFALALAISVGSAVAQQPTQAQINAIRQSCRADYQTHCASVPTGGSAALGCLKANAQSLSPACGRAVSVVGGPAAPTQGAASPGTPAPATAMSPQQEAALLRRACAGDYRAYCSSVQLGGGRITECLRENAPSLSRACRSAVVSARQGR